MKVELINFRVFSHASFSFQSNYTLISGPSGSGKTSILMAIHFAITGEGKKVVKHGKTNCKVTLSFNSLSIVRTKGPCRLIVELDNKVYEDAEAQSIINIKASNWEFGYVSQRLYKSFLLMSPSDKLTLIEKIAFTGFDINELQNKCKSLISDRKSILLETTNERITTEKILNNLGYIESECINSLTDKSYLLIERDKTINKRDELEKKIEESIRTRDKKNRLLDELNELTVNLKELEVEYGKTTDLTLVECNLCELITQLESYNRYQSEKSKLDETTPHSGMTELEIDTCITDMLNLQSLNSDITKLQNCRSELEIQNNYKKTHAVGIGNCPSCKIPIFSWNGELLTDVAYSISESEAEKCEMNRIKLMENIASLESYEQKRNAILMLYDGELCINDQLTYMKHVKYNDKIWLKCNELECNKPAQDINLLIKQLQTRESINSSIKLLRNKIERINETLLNLNDSQDPTDLKLEIYTLNKNLEVINNNINMCDAKLQWNKVNDLRLIESDMETKLPRAVKLSSLIKTAERLALDDVIFNINLRAGIYLSRFLPNVNGNLIFDTKKTSEKIDIKIEINGECTDINSLSGGEFARLVLAFALAMAEMNNIHTLMLDESFAALDADTTECVLDTIKENYVGKVIIIAHQTTKGLFDDVVDLSQS